MGELINLRRVKKATLRATKEKIAAANRVAHGTPKHLKKLRRSEKQRADQKFAAHKLDPEKSQ
jgi:hypothetical protein